MNYVEVCTTFPSEKLAESTARKLLESRLVGCTHVEGAILSQYWWEGEIERASEWRMTMKTRDDLIDEIESVIQESHEYEVPQIVVLPILRMSQSYQAWLEEQLK